MGNDRMSEDGGGLREASCCTCLHKHLNKSTCDAYPSGIPRLIISGRFNHTIPFEGDHGIHFEPIKPLEKKDDW